MVRTKRMASVAAVLGLATVGVMAMPHNANAWWRRGVWIAPIYVPPPPVYYAPPVVYARPPVVAYYAPRRVWIEPHWYGGYWVRGHWR
jgi:hypothetical protein